jgi:hypothetical protein
MRHGPAELLRGGDGLAELFLGNRVADELIPGLRARASQRSDAFAELNRSGEVHRACTRTLVVL